MIRVLPIGRRRVERQQHVRPSAPYLTNQLATEVQGVHQLGVGVTEELDAASAQHSR